MDLKAVARETLRILDDRKYVAPSGRTVEIDVDTAVKGTVLHRPGSIAPRTKPTSGAMRIEVTNETTSNAARRLSTRRVCALNFASARNPGGGFLTGAKAQEEDIARGSALYPCLIAQPDYYAHNRAEPSALYTDHAIYSPDVPFFRDDRLVLAEEASLVSVITAPAPNKGALDERDRKLLSPTLARRAAIVLEIAATAGHRTLVLGAWGCGVFRNDPREVAEVFRGHLASAFADAFDHVVFAIYDRSGEKLRAFEEVFKQE